MATTYTSILGLAKPAAGELTGTWGTTVNAQVTDMVEEAIAGLAVHNMASDANYTLTTADGSTSQARAAMVEITDTSTNLSAGRDIIVPAKTKMYIFKNSTAQILTVKVSGQSGVAVPAGKTMLLHCDATNVEEAINEVAGNLGIGGTLIVDGATTMSGALNVVNGNFALGVNKFTIAVSDGDTAIAGTLDVTGAVTGASISASPALAGSAVVTGAINASTFASYKGKRIIFTGSSNVEFDLPDATDTVAVGDTWVIVNASQKIITLDPIDGDNTIKIATGSTYTGSAGANTSIAKGGVAELVVVANHEFAIFGSGISQ
tara:strand:+ start:174 stop:1130 length:957 start_codon:yes stop_codon:yes gene_type:complete